MVARLGPIQTNSYDNAVEWFIPDRSDYPSFGWRAKYGSSNLQLTYMDRSAFRASVGYWGLANGADSYVLPLSPVSLTSLSSVAGKGYIMLGDCQFTSYYGMEAAGMDATITGVNPLPPTSISVPDTSMYFYLGGSITPDSPSTDNIAAAFLWDNAGVLTLYAGLTTLDSTADLTTYSIVTGAVNYPGPKLKAGAFYGFNPATTDFYLSGYLVADGSPYTCFWDSGLGSAPTILTGLDSQISTILSDGRLLARKDGITKIYSSVGALEATLNTGNLRFCYEINSGGIYYSVFSRTYRIQDGKDSSDSKLFAEAFRVPTADLASLGD